jgi:hypothetical protein
MGEWKLRLLAEEVATYEMAHRWLLREGAIIGSWSIDYLMHAEIELWVARPLMAPMLVTGARAYPWNGVSVQRPDGR